MCFFVFVNMSVLPQAMNTQVTLLVLILSFLSFYISHWSTLLYRKSVYALLILAVLYLA